MSESAYLWLLFAIHIPEKCFGGWSLAQDLTEGVGVVLFCLQWGITQQEIYSQSTGTGHGKRVYPCI
jgi:hypothetical protein